MSKKVVGKKNPTKSEVIFDKLVDAKPAYTPTKPFRKKVEMPASHVEEVEVEEVVEVKKGKKAANDKQKAFNDARELHVNQSLIKHDAWFANHADLVAKMFKAEKKKSEITKALEPKLGKQAMHATYYILNRLHLIETKNDSALVKRHDELRKKALKNGKK